MNFLIYLGFIILFKQMVDNYYKNIIMSHGLFRSFFCFFISTISLCFSIYNWDHLLYSPLEPTNFSIIINKLMLSYTLVDTTYFVITKQTRYELILHHLVCIFLYGLLYDKSIMAFCALGEILSAFNWVGILYPQYEWSVKFFKLYSILFIRFFVWGYTLFLLYQNTFLFLAGLVVVLFFFILDCYWAGIIITNYIKHYLFIKNTTNL